MSNAANRIIMSAPPKSEFTIDIDYTDADTGKKYEGSFTFKYSLSMADTAAIGRIRRNIMGGVAATSLQDDNDYLLAHCQAEIGVRAVAPIPAFWTAKQGDDLPADLVREIGTKMTAEVQKVREQRATQAEQARAQMRKAQS